MVMIPGTYGVDEKQEFYRSHLLRAGAGTLVVDIEDQAHRPAKHDTRKRKFYGCFGMPGRTGETGLMKPLPASPPVVPRTAPASIAAAPAGNMDDQDDEGVFLHFVNHAEFTHEEAPEPSLLSFERVAQKRLLRQPIDGLRNALAIRNIEAFQLPGGALFNLYREFTPYLIPVEHRIVRVVQPTTATERSSNSSR